MMMSHSNLSLLFFILIIISSMPSSTTTHTCSRQETHALLLFKQSLTSTNETHYRCQDLVGSRYHPIMRNWKRSIDCCNWNGVTCHLLTGHVIALDLTCGMLQGTLPPNTTLLQLPHLQRLNLAFNNFSFSMLPHEIRRFSNTLTHLNLSDSGFTGQLPPEISFLTNLVSLDLSLNWMEVEGFVFNNLLQNTTHLRELVMGEVDMSGWVLPTYLNPSSSLTTLDLSLTGLQGKLPDNIFSLSYLEKLDLSYNDMVTVSSAKVNTTTTIPLKWLDLSDTNFSSGEIPDSIFHLKSLNYLTLYHCRLRGPLPKSLINHSHLIHLDLSDNMLNGTLPSFLFTLPFLQHIHLYYNMLSGSLPSELFNHQPLRTLYLTHNQFDGMVNAGSTPPSINQLTNLVELDISYNNFKGLWELDTLLSSLPNLTYLDLSYNGFTVVTNNASADANPDFWLLKLASCKLNVFPESLRSMKKLGYLDLSDNNIGGRIPDWAGEKGGNDLSYLNLSHNLITGLPQFQWDGMQHLYLQSNQIKGPFPPSICNMSNLNSLDMSNNSFNEVIPPCVVNMTSLVTINLGSNNFHGTVPNMCMVSDRLEGLLLNGNQLGREIPTSLSICSNLKILDVGNNQLNGTFPSWLGDLPHLQVLDLRSNNLHGAIVTSSKIDAPFPALSILDLSSNQFVGRLPRTYFQNFNHMKDVIRSSSKPVYMSTGSQGLYYSIVVVVKGFERPFTKILVDYTIIDLSNNMFEGDIPEVIGTLNSLISLNLSHNILNGQIPHELANLSSIESLDLSWNKLAGKIPQGLADITNLQVLNLSHNNLTGRIPEGKQFNTFDESSYLGNLELCGFPLPKRCGYQSSPSHVEDDTDEDQDEDESLFTWKMVMSGFGCGTVIGLVMGYAMLSTGRPRWFNSIADAGERMIQRNQQKKRRMYIGK